jgi:hypothetical protein
VWHQLLLAPLARGQTQLRWGWLLLPKLLQILRLLLQMLMLMQTKGLPVTCRLTPCLHQHHSSSRVVGQDSRLPTSLLEPQLVQRLAGRQDSSLVLLVQQLLLHTWSSARLRHPLRPQRPCR